MQVTGFDIIWVLIAGILIPLIFGIAYFLAVSNTHKKVLQAQEAKLQQLKISEEKYKGLFENALAGIMKFRVSDWKVLNANEALRAMFGCQSEDELEGCIGSLPDPQRDLIKGQLKKDGLIGRYEMRTTRMNGEDMWVLFSAKADSEDGSAQAVLIDITERKHYEDKIREQTAFLDQAQDAFIVVDLQGFIRYWNSGGELLYGWKSQEALGKSLFELVSDGTPAESYQSAFEAVRQFNVWNGELTHKRKDQKHVLVESRWKLIEGKSNEDVKILIVNTDITDKKRIESQMVRAQRAESVALLTGGLAHDLQNILAPVKMSARFLKKKVTGKSSQAVVKALEERATSGLQLVRKILTYGHGSVIRQNELDIKKIIKEVSSVISRVSKKRVQVVINVRGQRAHILGDAGQLKQVFTNLCLNAYDAMPKGGLLKIEAADVSSDESLAEVFPNAEPGAYVIVKIEDTGTGIPPEDIERIFEPFFTSKENTGGTGLGLSIAKGIITSHRGYITVESVVGKGTTFSIHLPIFRGKGKKTVEV